MHVRLINIISLTIGVSVTACLFLTISHFLTAQVEAKMAPRMEDDLEKVSLALPPPPPPPKIEEKPVVVEAMPDSVAIGIQEEASSSPVKIPPSLPNYDELLPVRQLPAQLAAQSVGLETSLKPNVDITLDTTHVYQKNEVDKMPFLISRPDLSVPAYLRDRSRLSVVALFIVDTHGAVGNVRILQASASPTFDSIVTANLREWMFSPAIKKGRPVRCMIQQLVIVQWSARDPFSL